MQALLNMRQLAFWMRCAGVGFPRSETRSWWRVSRGKFLDRILPTALAALSALF